MKTIRPHRFWWFLPGIVIFLAGCQGLPSFSQINVPQQAFVGIVPISIEVDPRQAQLQEVSFSFWQGNGENGQQSALNCVPVNGGPKQLCRGNIPFNTAGAYSYEFSTKGRVMNDATTVKTQAGRIIITAPEGPPGGGGGNGGDPPGVIDLVAPVLINPEQNASCVGVLSGNKTNVNFNWQEVPGTRHETGAYQIEIHRLSSNCTPVNWDINVGRDNDDCWIANQNFPFHSENLDQGTEYRWRVRASRSTGNGGEMVSGPFSEFQSFKTAAPPNQSPTFIFPTEGSVLVFGESIVGDTLHVKWSQAECLPESYRLELVNRSTNAIEATSLGVGHEGTLGVTADRQYRLRLIQETPFGDTPAATVNFSTRQ
jgi:hypothetical protein